MKIWYCKVRCRLIMAVDNMNRHQFLIICRFNNSCSVNSPNAFQYNYRNKIRRFLKIIRRILLPRRSDLLLTIIKVHHLLLIAICYNVMLLLCCYLLHPWIIEIWILPDKMELWIPESEFPLLKLQFHL